MIYYIIKKVSISDHWFIDEWSFILYICSFIFWWYIINDIKSVRFMKKKIVYNIFFQSKKKLIIMIEIFMLSSN